MRTLGLHNYCHLVCLTYKGKKDNDFRPYLHVFRTLATLPRLLPNDEQCVLQLGRLQSSTVSDQLN